MSDAERTEKPTARHLRRARERGDVPRSALASGVLALLGALTAVALGAEAAVEAWRGLVLELWVAEPVAPAAALGRALDTGAAILLPPLALAVALGALGSLIQVGPLLSAGPLRPRLERLDPSAGFARVFGGRGLAAQLGPLPLALGLGAVALLTLREALPGLLGRVDLDAPRLASASGAVAWAVLGRAGALLAVGAAIAVAWARWRWWREQHMTRREVRREQRETEGDPTAKRRRARVHREQAMGPTLDEVRARAALLVVSPALIVAVEWSDRERAPTLLAVVRGAARAELLAAPLPVAEEPGLALALAGLVAGRAVPRALWPRLAGAMAGAAAEARR